MNLETRPVLLPVRHQTFPASSLRASMCSGLNVNGAGSEAIKTQRQDVVLAPAQHAIQMPAAAVIRILETVRNVDVFA